MIISTLIIILILRLFINNLIPGKTNKNRDVSLSLSIITLYYYLGELLLYNSNNNEFQNRVEIFGFPFGLDGIGISLLGLIIILDPILILLVKGEREEAIERKRILNYLILIQLFLIVLFSCLDLFIFFTTFELILIPMFLLITRYGSKYQYFLPRLEAGIRFFMYTMIGSMLIFLGIAILYIKYGTTSNELLNLYINETINTSTLSNKEYFNNIYLLGIIWAFLFFSFLIKIPMFPFHGWLPLAHSDAPTIGSIILAAILLKLASFGILRYSLYLFQPLLITEFSNNFTLNKVNLMIIYDKFLPLLYLLALISIIYCSLIPLRGIFDLKKIIAYSSIIHMNFSIFGFFSKDLIGLTGASLLMFTHAFISSALFLLIGILYKRYHSRFLPYFQGLSVTMPLFTFFFIFFSLANISLPFCSSFLSEFFILISSIHFNPFISFLLALSLIISSSFVIWLANRLLFGNLSPHIIPTLDTNNNKYGGAIDISITEFITLMPFFLFTFFLTFFPQPLISLLTLPLTLFI
jgi:proton-translocating NADH-quinone oxidoreductase chain M